jgi:hypothetical protein
MAVLARPSASALESSLSLIDIPPNGVSATGGLSRFGVQGKAFRRLNQA